MLTLSYQLNLLGWGTYCRGTCPPWYTCMLGRTLIWLTYNTILYLLCWRSFPFTASAHRGRCLSHFWAWAKSPFIQEHCSTSCWSHNPICNSSIWSSQLGTFWGVWIKPTTLVRQVSTVYSYSTNTRVSWKWRLQCADIFYDENDTITQWNGLYKKVLKVG